LVKKIFAAAACMASVLLFATPGSSGQVKSINAEIAFEVYLTGYSYWDNTPPGSADIARPVIHNKAGGKGTYQDPITLAVGHAKHAFSHKMDFPTGTRFYFPRLRKYAIVEDLCGDGPKPQNGPCHSGKNGNYWVDIYVDGQHAGEAASNRCMYRITGMQDVIMNPKSTYPAAPGALTESGCSTY
jgi:hypothetical protein